MCPHLYKQSAIVIFLPCFMTNKALSYALTHVISQQPCEKMEVGISSQSPKTFPFVPGYIARLNVPASLILRCGHGQRYFLVHKNSHRSSSSLFHPQQTCRDGGAMRWTLGLHIFT